MPLIIASVWFPALDPNNTWSEQYLLHVMVLGTVLTYLCTEAVFAYRDTTRASVPG